MDSLLLFLKQQTWKSSSKPANATFMDPNNPHWGWNWLERWMAARPWEGQNTMNHNNHASARNAASHTMSVGEITRLYALRDQNHNHDGNKNPPSVQKASCPRSHNSPTNLASKPPSSSTPANGKAKASSTSPKGSSWGGDSDSKSMFNKNSENNRRHSIAVSPVRDDESLASSPASASASTKVAARMRSKVQSPSFGVRRNGTPDQKGALVKKQLSFPASPAASRRHSVPTKVGMVSNKNVATNKNVASTVPEEKVKVRNGGSR